MGSLEPISFEKRALVLDSENYQNDKISYDCYFCKWEKNFGQMYTYLYLRTVYPKNILLNL